MQSKSVQAETTLQSMLPSQVSRKCGGRERFRGQQPLGSDFPCFTTTRIVFQEACLKEFFFLLSPKRRELRRAPFCHSQQHNAWVCLPAALSTAKATLSAQVFSQHSSKERKHFDVHKAIPLPHSQEMPGSESSCSEISSQLFIFTLPAGGLILNQIAKTIRF